MISNNSTKNVKNVLLPSLQNPDVCTKGKSILQFDKVHFMREATEGQKYSYLYRMKIPAIMAT